MKQFSKLFLSLTLLFAVSNILASDVKVPAEPASGSKSESVSPDAAKAPVQETVKVEVAAPEVAKTTKLSLKSTEKSTDENDKEESKNITSLADCPDFGTVNAIFLPRPQYLNSAALGNFMNPFLYGCDSNLCDTCFTAGIGYRYNATRKPGRIAAGLFGAETLDIQGSLVADRPLTGAIIADYFGLDPLYKGTLSFKPSIKQHQVDFAMRWELGSWADCLDCAWFGVAATLVHAKWALNADPVDGMGKRITPACNQNPNNTGYLGYMNNDVTLATFTSAPADNPGYAPATKLATVLDGSFLFGDMQTKWEFGKFDLVKKSRTDTKLANIDLVLGYDFARCADYHFGLFFKAVAPTGTKLDKEFVEYRFNPIIGNGHHWEIGGGLSAHWDAWKCDNQCFGIYLEGSVTTLLKNKQWRTFGLLSRKPMAEYMLLKEFTENSDGTFSYIPGTGLMNAVNYTTRQVQSSFKIQGDATLRLQYQNCGWLAAIGYNIYGRSKEKLCKTCEFANDLDARHFGIKGVAGVGFFGPTGAATWSPDNILNATQTDYADIDAIYDINGDPISPRSDFSADAGEDCNIPNIDNPGDEVGGNYTWDGIANAHTDATPLLISCTDINFEGGRVKRQIEHKIFGQLGYQWEECDWKPYFTVGGEYNFVKKCDLQTPISWGIWLQGGISF